MKTGLCAVVASLALGGWIVDGARPPRASSAQMFQLAGGSWWNGAEFEPRTMYAVAGTFSAVPPSKIDSTIHLDGMFVVPPFAEAHTHTIAYVRSRNDEFLAHGVFYALVMNVDRTFIERSLSWFNRSTSVDVNYTTAAVTAADGHPIQIGARNGRTVEQLDGDWVTVVERPEDIESKWETLADANPDLIKTFLVYSEMYAERKGDPAIADRHRGMDPALLPEVVRRAHAAGLRVATHVRTAHDFQVAVHAGVDIIAHLPGFSMGAYTAPMLETPERVREFMEPERFRIARQDAQRAAEQGTTVITTVGGLGTVDTGLDPETAAQLRRSLATRTDVLRHNLTLLRDAGVRVAIGSDAGEGSPVTEALVVNELGVFNEAELLQMLTEHASRVTFPRRSIGRLGDGYEASFLALELNPLEDFAAIRSIRLRFKQGVMLPRR